MKQITMYFQQPTSFQTARIRNMKKKWYSWFQKSTVEIYVQVEHSFYKDYWWILIFNQSPSIFYEMTCLSPSKIWISWYLEMFLIWKEKIAFVPVPSMFYKIESNETAYWVLYRSLKLQLCESKSIRIDFNTLDHLKINSLTNILDFCSLCPHKIQFFWENRTSLITILKQ